MIINALQKYFLFFSIYVMLTAIHKRNCFCQKGLGNVPGLYFLSFFKFGNEFDSFFVI
jgi:hypothetical protein